MFSWGKKTRAAEAIRRGVRAVLTGAYLHHSEIEKFGLNKSASASLMTEAFAHQVYALGYVSANALRTDKWATLDFFFESAIEGMEESEKNGGPSTEQISPILLNRYADFDEFSGQQRVADEHYKNSALLVKEHDPSADIEAITAALKAATTKYVQDARKMFEA